MNSIDQLLKETEKEAPKTATKPAQKSADSSDDDFVSDDDEGKIYTIITSFKVTTFFDHAGPWSLGFYMAVQDLIRLKLVINLEISSIHCCWCIVCI